MSQRPQDITQIQWDIASSFLAFRNELAKDCSEKNMSLLVDTDNELAALFATNPYGYSGLKNSWTRKLIEELSHSASKSRKYEILRSYVKGETNVKLNEMRKLQ